MDNQTELKVYSGQEVWDYISKIKSKHHSIYEDPIHNQHQEQILNCNYLSKDVSIDMLIKNDVDTKYFMTSQLDFYKKEWGNNNVDTYGLIGNSSFAEDVLIDGFHRTMQMIINGEKTFRMFVPLNSKFI